MNHQPQVTVIVLNFNGREHLEGCLGSVMELDYPKENYRLLFVDNDSTDDSVEFVTHRFPDVEILRNQGNLGYAAAINKAVAQINDPVVALLNNDTRAEPGWLTHLVEPFCDDRVVAVGSKVRSWDGKTIDYAGGGCNFHGVAFQVGQGEKDRPEFNERKDTLFACGAAMAVRREAFLELGGLDDDYFAYYEDVDFGWRCWVAGHRVVFEPRSIVFHHHSATSVQIPIYKLRVLHIRNPLFTIFKNYDDANLARILPAALLVSLKRTWYLGQLDANSFRIGEHDHHHDTDGPKGFFQKSRPRDLSATQEFPKVALSDLVAYNDLLVGFESMTAKRAKVQDRRARPDEEILELFHRPYWSVEPDPTFSPFLSQVMEFFRVPDVFSGKNVDLAGGRKESKEVESEEGGFSC